MSEYWKSTPKYWCKFCQVYVKDTKFEKQQHEAGPRHQGNVQRSIRNLHKDREREDREKQMAKNEVARLNGTSKSGGAGFAPLRVAPEPKAPQKHRSAPLQTTVDDRKRQLQQLADMGVAIPEDFRKDMVIPGEWQTVSRQVVGSEDVKPDVQSFGIHKRKLPADEEEELEAELFAKRKGWGAVTRDYPGQATPDDIEALLNQPPTTEAIVAEEPPVKQEGEEAVEDEKAGLAIGLAESVAKDDDHAPSPVVFKKRKAKILKS